ncbi:energy-coupling factor transporter transmembrane component T family protein [Aeromicrobium duanguangcaii]|uniref:Energy-coupling factor transporter transmembrane protein EcfT n=1 Tax=Aeromicrobium duanguangcaii TaxID=2968086 RepID=A0ABY5KG15_9ACTN|nr:energy-coupling factor transporter transmembrane protein EcfT [Aeromicrobium duanguangcaii]MCD9154226.1 energy-coupling factor transporter transmembrane protein EcfT [Aeromicrobium duanguangcaii]UUI68703.1 energy-coupling factor transporter transmembrane protein EcfT [Aeromicrobium duanguangcaii]
MRRSLGLGLYVPGDTVLHRLSPGPKLLGLLVLSIGVVAARGPWLPVGVFVVAIATARWVGMSPRTLAAALRPVAIVMVVAVGFQWWMNGWQLALEVFATVLALVVAAAILTATTPTDEMLDSIVRWLGPFRRFGVNPEVVALAFSLVMTSIPTLFTIFGETRDAANARGLGRSPKATLTPAAIRVVAHAYATGDALHARGILDDPDECD